MKHRKPNSLLLAAVLLPVLAGPAPALLVSLNPTADTFITDGNTNGVSPTNNFGTLGAISVAGSASGNGGEYLALLKFNLAPAVSQFDLAYGSGNWTLSSATLQLAANFGTQGAAPNNARFPVVNGGPFSILWFSDDTWTETGVTYSNFSAGTTASLGNFNYVPPGNNVPVVWNLELGQDFLADVTSGGDVSVQLAPGNSTVSYNFNSRTYNTSANWTVLAVTAVPEPSVVMLALVSLVLIAVLRRIRARPET
jgi:hypothetical protein